MEDYPSPVSPSFHPIIRVGNPKDWKIHEKNKKSKNLITPTQFTVDEGIYSALTSS